jgi:hypothetical protein
MKDHPDYVDPNAINEKKIKFWSSIIESPCPKKLK